MPNTFTGVLVKISELANVTLPLGGTEEVPAVQDDQTRKAEADDFAAAIPPGTITNAMLADMLQDTIKGRADGAGTGPPQDLTAAQVATIVGPVIISTILPISNSEMDTMTQGTIKGRTLLGGTGTPVDLTPTEATAIIASILLPIDNSEMATMVQGTVKGRTLAGGTGTPVDLTPTELTAIVGSILLPIDNTELSDMTEATIKGRAVSAGTGDPQDLTQAQVRTLVTPLANANLADMAQATVKGRALAAGTGAPTDLSQTELTNLILPGTNLVGRLNVPVLAASTRQITATDAGKGIVQQAAASVTLTLAADATENLGDGFVTTIAVSHASGIIVVDAAGGVTLTDFGSQSTGDKTLTGIGIATLWRLGADAWGIHGTGNLA